MTGRPPATGRAIRAGSPGFLSALVAAFLVVGGVAPRAASARTARDPLPSWNEGPAKKAILGFVILSVLWVLILRFVPPPITLTMLGDVPTGGITNALNVPSLSAEEAPKLKPYMALAEKLEGSEAAFVRAITHALERAGLRRGLSGHCGHVVSCLGPFEDSCSNAEAGQSCKWNCQGSGSPWPTLHPVAIGLRARLPLPFP